MPVIQRQIIPRTRPTGFEKFMAAIQAAATVGNAAAGIKDHLASGKEADERLKIEKANQQSLAAGRQAELDKQQDSFLINHLTLQTQLARNSMYDTMEQQGQSVDPALRGAAITLGDVLPQQRDVLRKAIARQSGIDPNLVTIASYWQRRTFLMSLTVRTRWRLSASLEIRRIERG
jgi:hypothetical protein